MEENTSTETYAQRQKRKKKAKYREKTKAQRSERPGRKYLANMDVHRLDIDVLNLTHTLPGWIGIPLKKGSVNSILDDSFRTIRRIEGKSTVLVDSEGRAFGFRVTPAPADEMKALCEGTTTAIDDIGAWYIPPGGESTTRPRGRYEQVQFGIGGGAHGPNHLENESAANEEVAERLRTNEYITKCARHITRVFQTWAPQMHAYYREHQELLLGKMEELELKRMESELQTEDSQVKTKNSKNKPREWKPNFPDFPFMATKVSLGPVTVTEPHRDSQHLSFGPCAMMAFGDYDYTQSGKLILHDLKVSLEVAPGDIVLIPSACIVHSTSSLSPGETRYSLVSYTSGQLFSWVHNGYRTKTQIERSREIVCLPKPKTNREEGLARWRDGWDLYMKVSESDDQPIGCITQEISDVTDTEV